ncbi:MAG TPA: formylglycine-generating enzyme family protein [Pirellulales bacterium]|nr:formylglycine-generating enzyme family protein [Pirellulales bacterium]
MQTFANRHVAWLAALASLAAAIGGACTGSRLLDMAAMAFALGGVWSLLRRRAARNAVQVPENGPVAERDEPSPPAALDSDDLDSFVDGMLARHRYALLLRRQLVSNLTEEQYARARDLLEENMALVPAGSVSLTPTDRGSEDDDEDDDAGRVVKHVNALFLDRYPVTNLQYREFVEAGGYEQMSIWEPAIWTAVLDFVDATGMPGPRFWKHGRYPRGEEDFPVVGVCWYEACAYARWTGKRLPTEPEWVKAGSWPVPLSDRRQWQRRFPWGDTMDRERCNLWGSGPGKVVAVGEFSSGVSVGGVYQLIGNVWEWTTGNFGGPDRAGRELTLPTPMKSIRGGAFDTYFENQATCHFQSGETPLARKHNIGFRCALSLCDVATPTRGDEPVESAVDEAETQTPAGEGVEI